MIPEWQQQIQQSRRADVLHLLLYSRLITPTQREGIERGDRATMRAVLTRLLTARTLTRDEHEAVRILTRLLG